LIRNNNQNGRRRGRGGARPPQGGGPSGNYGNTSGGGSRIDTRQRGNATQLLEKYKAMARDATQNGDRVQAEFYMQYADHYYRVLNEFRARDPQPAPRQNYDDDDGFDNMGGVGQNYAAPQAAAYADDGDDEEDGDEAPRQAALQPERQSYDRPSGERQSYDRPSGERQSSDRQNTDRQNNDRPNNDRNRNGGGATAQPQQRAYNGQRDGQGRDGYQRDNGQRDGQQRDGQQRATANRDAEPRVYRDDNRTDGSRVEAQSDERPVERAERVERAPRESYRRAPEPVADAFAAEPMIAGLPGPATIAAGPAPAPAAESVLAADAEPLRRPRGRPRKIVAPAADAADA
jgi:hypothetical protein